MTLFGTAGIRGPVADRLTPELAMAVGRAVGRPDRVVYVGRDGRVTGPVIADAVSAGLASAGASVRRVGMVPTPTLAHAAREAHGIMVTASHNPPADNGLKLFRNGAEYHRRDEAEIARRVHRLSESDEFGSGADEPAATDSPDGAASNEAPSAPVDPKRPGVAWGPPPAEWDRWGDRRRVDVLEGYREAVVAYARSWAGTDAPAVAGAPEADPAGQPGETGPGDDPSEPLDGLSIVVDCGCGVGALAIPQVLEALGATTTALNAAIDGHFPARPSKPTPETLAETAAFVREGPAKLGFGIDGDADRLVVLDGDGEVVHEDTVLAIVAGAAVERSRARDPVVLTTPNASGRIDERVAAAGGRVERVRLGALHEGLERVRDGHGASASGEANDVGGANDTGEPNDTVEPNDTGEGSPTVVFAAEPWKHCHPDFGDWIDAVAGVAVVATLVAAGGLAPLREPITEWPYRKESRPCPDVRKRPAMARIEDRLPTELEGTLGESDTGVRLERPDGSWTLVRPSGTEPYIRIYAEGPAIEDLLDRVRAVVDEAIQAVESG